MQLTDLQLKAGVPNQVYGVGRYVRILSGVGRLDFATSNGNRSEIITGVGLDLAAPEKPRFDWIEFTSPVDQTIVVLISEYPTTDSRLSGDVDVNGLLSVVNQGGSQWRADTVALSAGTAAEVLAADTERLVGTLQADDDVFIGPDATVTTGNGIKVAAGQTVNVENTGALYAIAAAATTVRVMESIK